MPQSHTSFSSVDIITPADQLRLQDLDEKQALEAQHLARLESIARLMDARFKLPILPLPIGLDTIVGLIPGIGDTISLGVSGVIVAGAHRLDIPQETFVKMGGNIFVDWLIGLVPIIGDLFDIGWQGNMRNVRLLREQLEARWDEERAAALND